MAKKQQQTKVVQVENQALLARQNVIAAHVLKSLGKPVGLQSVQVRWLWDDHFRVNVFTGEDVTCTKIVNSFFLVADNDGNVLTSTPTISRQY